MLSSSQWSFLLARLAVGTSMFGHGLVRIPKLHEFSNGLVGKFSKSILPHFLVESFSYILPFAELVIGILLLLGLFTRGALIAGSLTMIALIFGTSTIEEWGSIPSQLIHVAFFRALLPFIDSYNSMAVDRVLKKGI